MIAHQQPLETLPADAQVRERFHHSGGGRIEFPRVVYQHGRSRVLYLAVVGHYVTFHGDESAPLASEVATR